MRAILIMNGKIPFLILTVFFIFFASCNEETKTQSDDKKGKGQTEKVLIVTNESINQFYQTLGDLKARNSDTGTRQTSTLQQQWDRMRMLLLDSLSVWKNKALPQECINTPFLFYPFSGPDFIISNELFTKTKKVIMFGLEDPGRDISHRGVDYAASVIPKMQTVLRDYFGKGYFITGNMIKDLKSDSLRGVTPLLSTFILKYGYKIKSIRNFYLDSSGVNFNTPDSAWTDVIKGVQIKYTRDGYTESVIDYLSFNAENTSVNKHPELLKYFDTNIPEATCTYFKSASYLMHYASFSAIRDLCLKKSKYILQDDTGIPYKFVLSGWKTKIWGVYDQPIRDFSGVFQADLDSLYRVSGKIESIPFNMGYHYNNRRQNLMLFTKE